MKQKKELMDNYKEATGLAPWSVTTDEKLKPKRKSVIKSTIEITEGKKGVLLKFKSSPAFNRTEVKDINRTQQFLLNLINIDAQINLWKVLGVEKIDGDLEFKPEFIPKPGDADIIDLHLESLSGKKETRRNYPPKPPDDPKPEIG